MYIVYDFRCTDCTLVEERFVNRSDVDKQVCECGGPMKRLVCAPHLDWDSFDSPEAIRHFERTHKEKRLQEEKSYRDHGDYGAGYSDWKDVRPVENTPSGTTE